MMDQGLMRTGMRTLQTPSRSQLCRQRRKHATFAKGRVAGQVMCLPPGSFLPAYRMIEASDVFTSMSITGLPSASTSQVFSLDCTGLVEALESLVSAVSEDLGQRTQFDDRVSDDFVSVASEEVEQLSPVSSHPSSEDLTYGDLAVQRALVTQAFALYRARICDQDRVRRMQSLCFSQWISLKHVRLEDDYLKWLCSQVRGQLKQIVVRAMKDESSQTDRTSQSLTDEAMLLPNALELRSLWTEAQQRLGIMSKVGNRYIVDDGLSFREWVTVEMRQVQEWYAE